MSPCVRAPWWNAASGRILLGLLGFIFLFAPPTALAAEPASPARPGAVAPIWHRMDWNGEAAYVSTSAGWKAVVSLDRARLISFGPATSDANLLLAPPSRANRNILGGHRLWLGPQAKWARGWPPPAAWEYDPPASHEEKDGRLLLHMADDGDGWPRLTRTYRWAGPRLVCGAEISGGNRPAQVIHILQVPADAVVRSHASPSDDFPAGYVMLPSTAGPFAARFSPPPHLHRSGDALEFGFADAVLKVGFRPQPLVCVRPDFILTVERGTDQGRPAGAPDEGFFTQTYLGGREPFIELEQLSPLYATGENAVFEIVVFAESRHLAQ